MSRYVAALVYHKKVGSMARKAILAYCAERANDDGSGMWAAKSRIASEVECSKKTVIETIKAFVSEGLMVEVGRRSTGNGFVVEYDLDIAAIKALPDAIEDRFSTSEDKGSKLNRSPQFTPKGEASSPQEVKPLHPNRPVTVLEPSSSNVREILEDVAAPDAVASFIAYRRKRKGGALTVTAAKRLAGSLKAILDGGGDPADALGMAEERGWQSIQPDWYFNAKRKTGGQHGKPSSKSQDRFNAFIAGARGTS